MATLEDVVAATQFLAKESETLVACSCSDTRVRASDVAKVDGSASVTVKNFNSISNGVTSVFVNGPSDGVFGGKSSDSKQLNESGEKDSIGDAIDDKLEDSGHAFRMGDFVWGKIRSHPWWPGQVHDSRDALDFAEKHSQEGCLLVAFFGDGSRSWCTPSQLIPFVENFEEMSKSSSSKSFLNAVKMALDEICRLVESEMTCKCISEEIKVGLARSIVSNFGVKTGVLMPKFNLHPLFLGEYEPIELFAKLKNFAEGASFASSIELAVLTSWMSAFFRFNCGYPLSRYHRAFCIEGLEDESENVAVVMNDITVRNEVPIKGPHSDDENYRRRKQKSVAALMGEDTEVNPSRESVTVHEGVNLGKSRSSRKREKSIDGVGEGVGHMDSSIGKSNGRKKVLVSVSSKVTSEEVINAENSSVKGMNHVNKGRSSRKRKKIKVTSGEAKEESEGVTTPRERKKSRYLSPPYTNIGQRAGNTSSKREAEIESYKITKIARVGERMEKAAENLLVSPPLAKMVDEASEKELPDEHLERHDMPDKTSHCTENENDTLTGTISYVNSPSHCTENDKLMCSISDVNSPVDVILSEIQFSALCPFQLSEGGSFDIIRGFVSALRSSTYIEGANYNIYQNCKKGKRKESLPAQLRNLGVDLTPEKAKSSGLKPCKAVTLKTEGTSGKSVPKKADETWGEKTSVVNVEEIDATRLILTSSPEYPLPSKKDILKIFSKYGSLNKKETNISSYPHSFQIVYAEDSDAEAAFKSSLIQSPFGKNVNYRLQCSSTRLKSHGSQGRVSSPREQIPKELDSSQPSQPPDELMTEVSLIKQKFEIMTAILENYHLKFSPEEKSSLKDEVKRLMEMVETASEKVRIMAEGTKS